MVLAPVTRGSSFSISGSLFLRSLNADQSSLINLVIVSIKRFFSTSDDFIENNCEQPDATRVCKVSRQKNPNNRLVLPVSGINEMRADRLLAMQIIIKLVKLKDLGNLFFFIFSFTLSYVERVRTGVFEKIYIVFYSDRSITTATKVIGAQLFLSRHFSIYLATETVYKSVASYGIPSLTNRY